MLTTDQELIDRFRHIGRQMRMAKPVSWCKSSGENHEEIDDINKERHNSKMLHRELILIMLSDNGNSMKQKELADLLKISPSTLSEMIKRLESDGYIERNCDPTDRRATILSLSDKGHSRINDIDTVHAEATSYFFRNLDDSDKRELIKLLDKIIITDDDGHK